MRAPPTLRTARLLLRRPVLADAPEILRRYASDAEVTRFLGWPRHESVEDTLAFLDWSDHAWSVGPSGPYVILDRAGTLLGSAGLDVETPWRAATGYVLARDVWGRGYGTEVAGAMVELAAGLGLARLYALCHVEHHASARVLAKAGFDHEGVLRAHSVFPNLDPSSPADVQCWARV